MGLFSKGEFLTCLWVEGEDGVAVMKVRLGRGVDMVFRGWRRRGGG